MQDRLIFNGIGISGGRFYPLASMELNLISQISHSAYIYFIFNSLVFLCIGILFYKICVEILGDFSYFTLFAGIVVFINPAFVIVILGICYPEKVLCLALLLFIFASYRILLFKQYKFFILGLFAANYALYLKEPVFIIIGGFGLLYLIFAYKKLSKFEKFYCACLIFSAFVFLSIYIFFVIPNVVNFYGSPEVEGFLAKLIVFIASIRAVITMHIWLILLPLLIFFRILNVSKKISLQSLFLDILLLSGFLYFVAYCILGLFRTYYFAPIYFICIFSVLHYIRYFYDRFILKIAFFICIAFYLLNSLPQALWHSIFLKSQGIALKQTLEFLTSYDGYKNIYFYGLGRRVSSEEYFINHFGLYLKEIYKVRDFDILTDMENKSNILWRYDKSSNLSIFNSNKISTPKSGDLIILNANSYSPINKNLLDNNKYELLFKSEVIGLPNITLKTITKYVLYRLNIANFEDSNFFRMPINNYIYKVL